MVLAFGHGLRPIPLSRTIQQLTHFHWLELVMGRCANWISPVPTNPADEVLHPGWNLQAVHSGKWSRQNTNNKWAQIQQNPWCVPDIRVHFNLSCPVPSTSYQPILIHMHVSGF
eukprot:scpid91365/ scgid8816/ 